MKIGELAKRTNTSIKTIRFYEDSALLPPPACRAPGVAGSLAHPFGKGLMMRSHGSTYQTANPVSEQIDELRAEIGRLKAEGTTNSSSGSR